MAAGATRFITKDRMTFELTDFIRAVLRPGGRVTESPAIPPDVVEQRQWVWKSFQHRDIARDH